ncbi:MAG: peptide MFS transporter [Rikenellaceae bacterium]
MNMSNHPKGLYLLFATEMWERFSYYGMRALFILYMTQALLFDKELASMIYGNYTGLVFLTPLLGGYIADRFWGNRRSIYVGALVMALGQFMLFLSASSLDNLDLAVWLMVGGLFLSVMGNGLFKPNISTMVGQLYAPNDKRLDSAYTIFYMGINLGATIAPLWCGLVGNTGNPEDFRWGFLSACVGMIIGILVFRLYMNRYLVDSQGQAIGGVPKPLVKGGEESQPIRWFSARNMVTLALFVVLTILFAVGFDISTSTLMSADWLGAFIYSSTVVMPIYIFTDPSLSRVERMRIGVIYIIAFFVVFFWSAFEQAGAALTFFADEQTNRVIFGWEMPASYFQSLNPIFVVTLAPLFAALWAWLGRRNMEPSSPLKQALGLFLLSLGYLIIAFGVSGVEGDTKVSMMWLVSLYFIHTMGELCLSPIGLSMVNQLAPVRFASLLMGVWFLSMSAANKFSGVLSSYYPESGGVAKSFMGFSIDSLSSFFMLFVVMSGVAAVVLFLLSSTLNRMMRAS